MIYLLTIGFLALLAAGIFFGVQDVAPKMLAHIAIEAEERERERRAAAAAKRRRE